MGFEILLTTAEKVIDVIDAVTCYNTGCNITEISTFLDIREEHAENALKMGVELKFLSFNSNQFFPIKPFAFYLSTSNSIQKVTILRLFLEEYEPYIFFKRRLSISNDKSIAANEVKVKYSLSQHRDEIADTLVSLGTYARSLKTEGAGQYKVCEIDKTPTFYDIIDKVIQDRESAKILLNNLLGEGIVSNLNCVNIIEPLITSILELQNIHEDSNSPIVHAANAFESFLVEEATYRTVDLGSATGINSKAQKLKDAQCLNTKYFNITKYIGHIRNAADHGTDSDIHTIWDITPETSKCYVHIVINAIKVIYNSRSQSYSL
jgi:hypothetical protein